MEAGGSTGWAWSRAALTPTLSQRERGNWDFAVAMHSLADTRLGASGDDSRAGLLTGGLGKPAPRNGAPRMFQQKCIVLDVPPAAGR
jgi:hypothetical protein